jgi:hypothetical protein
MLVQSRENIQTIYRIDRVMKCWNDGIVEYPPSPLRHAQGFGGQDGRMGKANSKTLSLTEITGNTEI